MASRLFWENTNIGNTALADLQVAKDNSDRVFLRLSTKTRNDKIYNYVDEARQNVNGISFAYNDTDNDSDFVDVVLERACDVIQTELKSMQRDERKTTNVSPLLADAVKNMRKVYPKQLTITGYDNEVILTFEIIQQA